MRAEAESLVQDGYFIAPNFLSSGEISVLSQEIDQLQVDEILRPAGIGTQNKWHLDTSVRGDQIHWLTPDRPTPTQAILWNKLEFLKQTFNRELFLGLWSFEGHFALYPTGASYRRHLDSFQNDGARVLSLVLYLNTHWNPEDGGELRIHRPHQSPLDILPEGGKLVCFLSHWIEHEVLVSRRTRKSFTGWFRKRAGSLSAVQST